MLFVTVNNERRAQGYISLTEMARIIGCCSNTLLRRGLIPTHHFNGSKRAYYLIHEAQYIKNLLQAGAGLEKRMPLVAQVYAKGLYTVLEAARQLDMPAITLRSWLENKSIQGPKRQGPGGHKYWNQKELDAIKEKKKEYFANPDRTRCNLRKVGE